MLFAHISAGWLSGKHLAIHGGSSLSWKEAGPGTQLLPVTLRGAGSSFPCAGSKAPVCKIRGMELVQL